MHMNIRVISIAALGNVFPERWYNYLTGNYSLKNVD